MNHDCCRQLRREPAAAELTVSGLGARFGPLTALHGVDLTVRPGELVALAGENGAGKSTLVRCIAGDIAPTSGVVALDGRPVPPDPISAKRRGIEVVWQDLALCDNLDVASNVLLGREQRRQVFSEVRMRKDAARLFSRLGVPLRDPGRSVRSLSGGQRQLVAVARAMAQQPRLLLLDEPTAALGVQESALVEDLIARVREQGTTVVLACHDISQMFRLADRIAVLRHGGLIAEVTPSEVHPGDVVALLSGQEVDSSARRQLTRLHGLTDRLVSADPSSSLSLILSALGAALGSERLSIHLLAPDSSLVCAASLGLAPPLLAAWARLPRGPAAARWGWRPRRSARSSRTTCRRARPGRRSPTWPGRPRWPVPGQSRCWAPAACSGSSPCSVPRRASRGATTWTWPPCTPGMRPARSSGTGCWTR